MPAFDINAAKMTSLSRSPRP